MIPIFFPSLDRYDGYDAFTNMRIRELRYFLGRKEITSDSFMYRK